MAYRILNAQIASKPVFADVGQLAAQLKQAVNDLNSQFFDLHTAKVNYVAIKVSDAYQSYLQLAATLQHFDLSALQSQAERLAFWINLYNALTIHGIIELGIKRTVREIPQFFETVAYQLGSDVLSLDDIEHGILRQNQKKHWLARRPFKPHDGRLALMLEVSEPRIHFALVCGSQSCPPINTYQAKQIEQQLDWATSSFVNSDQVVLEPDLNRIKLSKLFKWYAQDFGTQAQLLKFLAHYRHDQAEQDWLREHSLGQSRPKLRMIWLDYDWGLN